MDSHDEQLALLLADLTDRAQRGEPVNLDEVCQKHPAVADELKQLWGAVMVADAVGGSSEASQSGHDSAAEIMDLALPCRLGDYEMLEELGRGGMGVVFRARQLSLNREVAVKMILRGAMASDADHTRFQAEAAAAARLDHPGIVPVYETGVIAGRPYFTMKRIEGKTLSQLLADGPIPSKQAAEILLAVSRAIHFAHQQGVLHRDLKPSNILIDNDGLPHVTDFGLAKQTSDPNSLTRTGAILGTPSYMPPEQAAGQRGQLGPASDVYSLGAILYHMLTGRPPFQAATPVDTVLLVLEQDPVPPRVLNPAADRDLEHITLRCLQKPTDLRYASSAGLANDLEAWLNDEWVSSRSGQFTQVLARWMRETHHAPVLENWGLLWMWHSLALFIACALTNVLYLVFKYATPADSFFADEIVQRVIYFCLWIVGFGAWAVVFWFLRRRMGPVMFVERQIAHTWAASMFSIAMLFPLEAWLDLLPLTLSPVLGLINGMMFLVKAGILSGAFYLQAAALFATTVAMALAPDYAHFIFGAVGAACFFFPGLKYYRQRLTNSRRERG